MYSFVKRALALFFPQQNTCRICHSWQDSGRFLCPVCEKKLLEKRMQHAIALPQDAPIRRSRAVWQFSGKARLLIYHLKYFSDPDIARFIGEWMSLLVQTHFAAETDVLIPVPLHHRREKERGYNQAVLLAREISFHTGLACCETALRRVRATATLVEASRQERMTAMQGAFEADAAQVCGKRVLLIDDVFTTGATSMACAAALLAAGARDVSVVTACHAEDRRGGACHARLPSAEGRSCGRRI